MDFIEKDLEDIIWETQQTEEGRKLLAQKGLVVKGKMFRQFYLGEYGTCDLITVEFIDKYPYITIYELKKGIIDVGSLMQACKYSTAVKSYIEYKYDCDCYIYIKLIGKSIQSNGDFVFLYNELMNNIDIITYSININGLMFNRESKVWKLTDEEKLFRTKIDISFGELRKICSFTNGIPF